MKERKIWWCEVHNDRGNPNFNNKTCWSGVNDLVKPCRMVPTRLVPDWEGLAREYGQDMGGG